MIKELARWFTSDNDIVLDFFAGSGTAAQSVIELNAEDDGSRKFMVVQLPEPLPTDSSGRDEGWTNIAQITRRRIDLAGERLDRELGVRKVDTGFRSFALCDTNFSKWRLSRDVEEDALQQHLLSLRDSATDDATADELLTEILLKQGYSLTEAVSAAEVGELDVRIVSDGDGDVAVLAYLDDQVKPKLEQLRALVSEAPTRIIVLEDAFQGDDELKTNLAQICKSNGIELWTA